MKPIIDLTLEELAAFIQSHLRAKGVEVVLTGGSVVAIYSQGKYLDFVVEGLTGRSKIWEAMEEIGFGEIGRHFEHPEVTYLVEFLGGPLSVGKQQIGKIDILKYETGVLRIISPTDCVKDRLAAYFYWSDRQSLVQAIMVAQDHDIDLEEIASWAEQEGMQEEYKLVDGQLN